MNEINITGSGPFELFIKFGQKEHLEEMQRSGILYMNTDKFFRDCEDSGRGDENENIGTIFQGENVELEINNSLIGNLILNKNNGLKVVRTSAILNRDEFETTNIFSMCCITNNTIVERNSNEVFNKKMLEEFGDHALFVVNNEKFFKRIHTALNQRIKHNYNKQIIINARYDFVDYIDLNKHNGTVGAFRKDIKYSYQNEWRVAIQKEGKLSPYRLKVGSLEDCTLIKSKADIINNSFWKENNYLQMII